MAPIAITAATLVAKWAAEGISKEAGKSAWSSLQQVYSLVRDKLGWAADSKQALERLVAEPTSESRVADLAAAIEQETINDDTFAKSLAELINRSSDDRHVAAFVTQVAAGAKVGKVTNIGTITGDVRF